MFLFQAMKIVIRKDSGFLRTQMFRYLASHSLMVRMAWGLYDTFHLFGMGHLFAALYGVKSFLALAYKDNGGEVLFIGKYRNELRQLDFVKGLVPESGFDQIRISPLQLLNPLNYLKVLICMPQGFAAIKQLQQVEKRHNFLITCRVASLFGYYLRLAWELRNSNYKASLVSSDGNPDAMALTALFKSKGKKSIYVDHAYAPPESPALFFDLSLLSGESSKDIYSKRGVFGEVLLKGLEGEYSPMQLEGLERERKTVGICLTTMVKWRSLAKMIREIEELCEPAQVILRIHPNREIRDPNWKSALSKLSNLKISEGENNLAEDIKDCDIVICGESAVHLNVLKLGKPSIHIKGMDLYPHDFYDFIKRGTILSFNNPSELDFDLIKNFYDANWISNFRYYDSHYQRPDLGETSASLKLFLASL